MNWKAYAARAYRSICTMASATLKSMIELFLEVITIFVFTFYNYFVSPLLFASSEIDPKEIDAKDSRVYNIIKD